MKSPYQVFVGFAAEDRYLIAEPIVYHLKNYGIPTWYDRHRLLLGDNHKEKCMINGAGKSTYENTPEELIEVINKLIN